MSTNPELLQQLTRLQSTSLRSLPFTAVGLAAVVGALIYFTSEVDRKRSELASAEVRQAEVLRGVKEAELSLLSLNTQLATVKSQLEVVSRTSQLPVEQREAAVRTAVSKATELQASIAEATKQLNAVTAPQSPEGTVAAKQYVVVSSGPKKSGAMKSFSDWYELCGETPTGYRVVASDFQLTGDRRCGAWAECAQSSLTERKVCWRFRMQGHDEGLPPGVRDSEGTLRITAQPAAGG